MQKSAASKAAKTYAGLDVSLLQHEFGIPIKTRSLCDFSQSAVGLTAQGICAKLPVVFAA